MTLSLTLTLRSHNKLKLFYSWLAGNWCQSHSCNGFQSRVLLASPTGHCPPLWLDKGSGGDWLIDCSMQMVILQSDRRFKNVCADMLWQWLRVQLKVFFINLFLRLCMLPVYKINDCFWRFSSPIILALGRKGSGLIWSCTEEVQNGVISLVRDRPFGCCVNIGTSILVHGD